MTQTKRQHYVPQFLLRYFSDLSNVKSKSIISMYILEKILLKKKYLLRVYVIVKIYMETMMLLKKCLVRWSRNGQEF